jgi:hypothetical protein
MVGINSINNVWKNVKEIDLRPIRQEAMQSIRIAIAGKQCARCELLANALRTDPARPEQVTQTPIIMVGPEDVDTDFSADLLILILSANEMPLEHQRELVSTWAKADKNILVLVDQSPEAANLHRMDAWLGRLTTHRSFKKNLLLRFWTCCLVRSFPWRANFHCFVFP